MGSEKIHVHGVFAFVASIVLSCLLFLFACTNPAGKGVQITNLSSAYAVFAWNDLGMHCLNPTYDKAVILPPYNTVWVQVVKRGSPPAIATGGRIPWASEPACGSCHVATGTPTRTAVVPGAVSAIAEVDTGSVLYRNDSGHGGLACAACHGSPHAMIPSREAKDNYQAVQYQGEAVTIGSCSACHPRSTGGGFAEFFEEHGGGGEGETSACKVCHTGFSPGASAASAPHKFQWRFR